MLPRPLLGAIVIALLLQLVGSLVLWSLARGALLATIVIIAVVDLRLGVIAMAIAAIVLYVRVRLHRSVTATPLVAATAAMLLMSTWSTVTSPAFRIDDLAGPSPARAAAGASENPSIFVVLLDAYPRSDTLAELGYDNGWFETELEQRGFDVAAASHSNYNITSLVVPTMFHMRHADKIEALTPVPEDSTLQHRAIRDAVTDNPVLDRIEDLGYTTISAGMPGWPFTLQSVDRYIDDGQMTWFEYQISARTMLGLRQPFLREQHRDRVLGTFNAITEAATLPGSVFMFAHVLSPHMPLVFNRAGELPPCDDPCRPLATTVQERGVDAETFQRQFADQVHYLNGLVLTAVDEITERDPDAIVVIFSDHGARADRANASEAFDTFFAARTPRHSSLFPADARSLDIFPVLFNAYFFDDHPIPDDLSYQAPEPVLYPLDVEPWGDKGFLPVRPEPRRSASTP